MDKETIKQGIKMVRSEIDYTIKHELPVAQEALADVHPAHVLRLIIGMRYDLDSGMGNDMRQWKAALLRDAWLRATGQR